MPAQHGKPVWDESLVLTESGERKRIDALCVGDRVITHAARAMNVSAIHIQGSLKCVRIKTELGRETVAALTHPFLTPDGWVNAGDLRPGDVLATVPKPQTKPSESDRPLEQFRLAGYFVGDGCSTQSASSHTCNATVTCVDPGVQADLIACAVACNFVVKHKQYKNRAASFEFSGGVREWLRAAGMAGHSSHTKRVPKWVFRGNREQIANFVGAYFDCDGSLSVGHLGRHGTKRKDPCAEFYSVNRSLLQDVQHLLLRLNVRSRISQKNGKYKGERHVSWRLTITSVDDVARFARAVSLHSHRGVKLRDANPPRTRFDQRFIEDKIVAVEDAGELPCRCLTVDEDHTFTSDDFVVHNTQSVTVAYAAWRMMREPGLRVGIGSHTQRYANKISKWIRRMVLAAGGVIGTEARADEWSLTNGSMLIARGVGGSIAGESIDLFMMDDVFGSREDADSVAVQEKVYDWYMDDVTPRLQEHAALVMVNTRWHPGDLIGRIQQSEEWPEWTYLRITAIAETQEERDRNNTSQGLPAGLPDFTDRQPGEPLCRDRFSIEKLLQKQRIEGVGFEALYQQNPIPRGGTFFERRWLLGSDGKPILKSIEQIPLLLPFPFGRRLIRYWDLASSRSDSACYTSGVLLAKLGDDITSEYWVCDVVRGRWMPAQRNEKMREIAELDAKIFGFEKTWFESPVFDKGKTAARAIYAALSGYPVSGDNVGNQGSKELRAEPVAGAAKGGCLKVIDGGFVPAFLNEIEGFPRTTYKDQVDSLSGAYNRLSRGGFAMSVG